MCVPDRQNQPWQVTCVRKSCPSTFSYGKVIVISAVILMLAAAPGYSFFQSTLTPSVEKQADACLYPVGYCADVSYRLVVRPPTTSMKLAGSFAKPQSMMAT